MSGSAPTSLERDAGARELDALVLGGNLAGLTVAYLLGHLGYRTALIEKSAVLGGMDRSFTNRHGRVFDCGVHSLDARRSEVTTKLFRHVIGDDVHRTRRRRGLVLRGHRLPYNAPVEEWPAELRRLLPAGELVDELGSDPPTRVNLACYYGRPFVDFVYDEVLASYPSETRHLAFGVEEWRLLTNVYPWFFPRAARRTVPGDPSRQYHDSNRSGRGETFLYPRSGGFGGFAAAFERHLSAAGVEVVKGADDLHVEMEPARQRVDWVRAGGVRRSAPRVFWCAPVGILCGLVNKPVPDVKPDTFVLGSFQFAEPLACEDHELIVGDPRYRVNRVSFPGRIAGERNDLVQLEFSFARHAPPAGVPGAGRPEMPAGDPEAWREHWTRFLTDLGLRQPDNALVDFDFRSFPALYNCFGVEGEPMPEVDFGDLHPESNLRPVLPTIRSVNLSTRVPQFLELVATELARGAPAPAAPLAASRAALEAVR